MKNLLFVAAALLGACATQPPKPAATPVEMTECIALAAPAAKAGATINEALAARRSWREFGPEKLSLEELSGVLWAAAGENRTDGKLTAPSALALYPITVYAVFEEGIYRYDGREQTLTRVAEGDHRAAAGNGNVDILRRCPAVSRYRRDGNSFGKLRNSHFLNRGLITGIAVDNQTVYLTVAEKVHNIFSADVPSVGNIPNQHIPRPAHRYQLELVDWLLRRDHN